MTIAPAGRLATALALLAAALAPAVAAPADTRVPFVAGLTAVTAVSEPQGDYESLHTIVSVGRDGYRMQASAQVPAQDGGRPRDIAVMRLVDAADQAGSHRMRAWFFSHDPPLFPGTVPGFSAAMVRDLAQRGATAFTYLDVTGMFGVSRVRRELSGRLVRVGPGPERLPVLVNGTEVPLAVIHARGTLSDGRHGEPVELYVLDDAANPLLLGFRGAGIDASVVRIEYPAARDIEQQLARRETVEIHSIYFAFNRADLRPESTRVLEEIAGILRRHPAWKLQIDGHTDAIGSDARNLALSRDRAAAVKAALVRHYGVDAARLATAGHGESQPRDSNRTARGRSHNRRVELRRL
jgi:outer membrane protein OmpA-like peptidoglycan-associated protein